jgi:L-threonylcarbamoyladenylate synthase
MNEPKIIPPEEKYIDSAVEALKKGGIIIFPTETVYGIGAEFRQVRSIERIFLIKRRPFTIPLLLHCANIEQMKMVVKELPHWAEPLTEMLLPGPLALILYRSEIVPDIITGKTNKVGVRIVAQPFFARVALKLASPLAGTSANFSGEPATNNFAEINKEILLQCDTAIDAGRSGSGRPSTILDLTTVPPRLLRQGEIGKDEIERVIQRKVDVRVKEKTQPEP